MAKIKKNNNSMGWWEDVEKLKFSHPAAWRVNCYSQFEKLFGNICHMNEIYLPYDPTIPFLGIYSREINAYVH